MRLIPLLFLFSSNPNPELTIPGCKEFTITINDIANEGLTIIEITDTILNDISYGSQSFSTPTKLIFTNLTKATGHISFSGATNLVFTVSEKTYCCQRFGTVEYSDLMLDMPPPKTITSGSRMLIT